MGRLVFALIYLALLFGGGWWLYARMQHFEGRMYLREGQAERLAARPSGQGLVLNAGYRGLPAELLPWEDPTAAARHFGADGLVDAAALPGRLQLRRLEILETLPSREVLEVSAPTLRETVPVSDGLPVPGTQPALRMAGVRPWSGLVRDPRGAAMAAIRFREAAGGVWSDALLAGSGAWSVAGDALALRFAWAADEAAARASLARSGPQSAVARWGVRDGGVVHWIEGLAEGSGIGLSDGSEVGLLRRAETSPLPGGVPALLLAHTRKDTVEEHWVPLGGDPTLGYLYEDPARAALLVELRAWREDLVLAAAWLDGHPLPPTEVAVGTPWQVGGHALVVTQAMAQAIPVPVVDPPVLALALEELDAAARGDAPPLLLREGAMETVGDARLRYRRLPTPPRIRAHLAYHAPGRDALDFALEAGQTRRLGDWVVALEPEHMDARPSVVLYATRTLGAPSRLFGAALFVIGATGLVWVRFARFRWLEFDRAPPQGDPPAADDFDESDPPDRPHA